MTRIRFESDAAIRHHSPGARTTNEREGSHSEQLELTPRGIELLEMLNDIYDGTLDTGPA